MCRNVFKSFVRERKSFIVTNLCRSFFTLAGGFVPKVDWMDMWGSFMIDLMSMATTWSLDRRWPT